jgi:membrane-bound lytic murein transglycosylase D
MKSPVYLFLITIFLTACQPSNTPYYENMKDLDHVSEIREYENLTPPQRITSLYIPKRVIFAGDTIPLHRPDVRQALEYELMVNTFRQSHTLLIIKNIERWRSLVSKILKESNVPEDFIYLAVIESEFDNNAQSYAGAMGMWQIMERTAKDYDLQINKDVDMRRDPKRSTEAACKFLQWSYRNLNDWVLTAASYNIGMSGMKTRLEEQKVDNFFDLHLNSETARYVYRIIAMKLILENPEAYGYFVPDHERYAPFRFNTVTVNEDIDNLVDFARKHNTTYKELRQLNPWFNNTSNFKLNVHKKESYEIRVPM